MCVRHLRVLHEHRAGESAGGPDGVQLQQGTGGRWGRIQSGQVPLPEGVLQQTRHPKPLLLPRHLLPPVHVLLREKDRKIPQIMSVCSP